MKPQILILLCLICLGSCAPAHNAKGDYSLKEDDYAILQDQLSDSLYAATASRKVKKADRTIATKKEALALAKRAFIREYGANDDIDSRIFRTHLTHGFWIVKGLLPRGFNGGTLVAIIDSESGDLYSTFVWR